MVDEYKLKASFDADVSKLLKGLDNIESSVTDTEKLMGNAFGGVDDILDELAYTVDSLGGTLSGSLTKGVSSISGVEDSVEDTERKVEELYEELKELGTINLKFDTFNELTSTITEAGVDIDDLGDHLKGLENTTINWSMLTRLGKEAKGAEGDVESLEGALDGLGSTSVGGVKSDIDDVGTSAKGSETDVDKFDDALDGVDGGGLKDVKGELDNIVDGTENAISGIEGMAGAIGGIVGVGGMSEAIDIAVDESQIASDLERALNSGGAGKRKNLQVGIDVVGEEYSKFRTLLGDDGAKELVRTISVQADTDDAKEVADMINDLGGKATTIAVNYDMDASEIVSESVKLSKILGISQEEALALQNTLLGTGFPPGEIDTLAEYGTQLHMVGFNAEEVQALFASGVETGTWNIDNLLDGLKEGRILLSEYGVEVDDAMAEMLAGTNISAGQLQEWGKAVAEGGEEGKKAYIEVAKALDGVEDKTKKNQLGVKLFGTMWEDNGVTIADTILGMQDYLVSTDESVKDLAEDTDNLESEPWVRLQNATANLRTTVGELLEPVVEVVATVAEWMSKNEQMAKVIMIVLGVLTVLTTILGIVVGVLSAVNFAMGVLGITSLATFGWIILAVMAVVAIIALLIVYWDEVVVAVQNFGTAFVEIMGVAIEWFKSAWTSVVEWLGTMWTTSVEYLKTTWASIVEFFTVLIETIVAIWLGIPGFFIGLWTGIIDYFISAWNTVLDWFVNRWNSVRETFVALSGFITTIWETIKGNVVSRVTSLVSQAVALFTNLYTGVRDSVNNVKSAVSEAIQGAFDAVTGWFSSFKEAGSNIVSYIAQGISGAWSKVKDAVSGVLQYARDLLPFSPPKDKSSPLVDIHKNGIVTQIAKGITDNKDGILGALREVLDVGDEVEVDDDPFTFAVGGYKSELSAVVNGNVRTSVDTTMRQENGYTPAPANINLNIGGRDYSAYVDDMFDNKNKRERLRNK